MRRYYHDTLGRKWSIKYDPPPIPSRACDWQGETEDGEAAHGRTYFDVIGNIEDAIEVAS